MDDSPRHALPGQFQNTSEDPAPDLTKKILAWDEFQRLPSNPCTPPDLRQWNPARPCTSTQKLLQESDCRSVLAVSWHSRKKWAVLWAVFGVQISMNFNAAVYPNAERGIAADFGLSHGRVALGMMIFLVTYAFGCELWAPWSEEWGRKWVMQASLLLVNITCVGCAIAPNFETVFAMRFLGGLFSAGGSVTLGMVADMWEPEEQQLAVAFCGLSSVLGSVVAPIFGGFIEEYLPWRWTFWICLILGFVVELTHLMVPETRSSILCKREARKRRAMGIDDCYGPGETAESKISLKEICRIWARPFIMLTTEPIVTFLSLLSGFSDALIFTFLESFKPVYDQWGFTTVQRGLAFLPLPIGYFLAYAMYIPMVKRQRALVRQHGKHALKPEKRLKLLLFLAPLLSIGLIGFAWTSVGPPVHWIGTQFFVIPVGMANYAIYMGTIDYMVAAYGPYASSATGGNGFARDLLAGISALYAKPLYQNIGKKYHLNWASTVLSVLGVFVTIPLFIFYFFGPAIRKRSKFAKQIAQHREEDEQRQGPSNTQQGGLWAQQQVEVRNLEK
ncbi:major facilitator superfamily domain-containing protein [Lineolata rhizophorae]|uniref:Major facilitator superfamily domain-containing protein n=1 Tax=Lineolata rhizophorae TaxID=578093 RepID=A0A6A6NYZ5_9PEZI|nr:major facilitator superfamily domain-containing protein [Lineolata rhizophorae]